ncbi:unnamed protein product [Toxocara canis]|uniref:Uncharacterized protein n=1 Tax=Toxocara canis TaxID=6265 RepID=A0A183VA67_TOXCA|nr:unnamed protein product [Toxocara canis]
MQQGLRLYDFQGLKMRHWHQALPRSIGFHVSLIS